MGILSNLLKGKNDSFNIDSSSFEKLINEEKNAVILDVRSQEENSALRIPNSLLIDIHKPDFLNQIEKLDKSRTFLVYCRSGRRSFDACTEMRQLGFGKVYNLKTGIIGWKGIVEKNQ